ncbi:2OG-Fe(II) oxygenase [Pseudonocardia sp. HH130630-07]|uniref:2OG-Fe(II) oxygenase n=1 Tax=Pseudonocardia sp. HH130630-07 TaxID=1690815 RepID=UPI00081517DC|nr:2OG-Fe(II) oxygenase [Pseudonocardia sp. HH130630-07]ANY05541.1 proline hydroxylase [Pseudonocardia sp. HH130630-07]
MTITGPAPADVPGVDLGALDWPALTRRLDEDGVAVTPPILDPQRCTAIAGMFDEHERFRSTVRMARHAFGEGSYRYFADPLPPLVQALRTTLYPPLARIANAWAERLGEPGYPDTLDELLDRCAELGQTRPTPLVLRYGESGYNCLHQDVYGDLVFPLQFLVMLSRPDVDFTGGESVFVEQRPRQQSRPIVLRPEQGQAVVFPVRTRPRRGTRGDHRVQLRHGVSMVHSGNRHVLGIIFHNAR